MKTSTKIISAFIAASAIALAVPLAAQADGYAGGRHCSSHEHGFKGGHMGGRHARGEMHRMLRGLDLSEQQRDAIFALRHEQAPQMREYMKQMRASHKGLHDLAISGEYDATRAEELAQQGAQAMADMAKAKTRMGAEVYKLLDERQREQFRQRMEHRKGMKHMPAMPARPLAS